MGAVFLKPIAKIMGRKMQAYLFCVVLLAGFTFGFSEDKPVEVYFSRQDPVRQKWVEAVREESSSILMAISEISDSKLIKALMEAAARGVQVEILLDEVSAKKKYPFKKLAAAGISVVVLADLSEETKKRKSAKRDAFCIFGKRAVWTGSYRLSRKQGDESSEHVVILKDNELVLRFLEEYRMLKNGPLISYGEFQEKLKR